MYTKLELIELARPYFKQNNVKKMYATTDGNFFFEYDKHYADGHASSLNGQVKVVDITDEDLRLTEKPKEEVKETPKEEVIAESNPEENPKEEIEKEVKPVAKKATSKKKTSKKTK